jgi:hypothetical protein
MTATMTAQRIHCFVLSSLQLTMESLTVGQKILNQRLLAEHCLAEHKLFSIWKQIGEHQDMGGDTLAETITSCNTQLRYIGLEIRCISIKNNNYSSSQSDAADGSESALSSSQLNRKNVKYYAIVNAYPDEVGMKSFMQDMLPGEINYIKLVLENLIDEPQDLNTLMNLRSEGEQEKLTLIQVDQILTKLLADKWIEWASDKRTGKSPVQIAPRSYMELAHLLTEELGMEKENLPQQIVH